MLKKQAELKLSDYSELYHILVPQDHPLRQLLELLDFQFVLDELKSHYCLTNGRNAVDPIQMFKYLFLKVYYDCSDRDLIERARTDLALKFFLGLNPEDPVIDPSLLSKFRRQRLKDSHLLDLLLKKSVQVALSHHLIQSGTIIVDATHTVARFNQHHPRQALQEKAKVLRKQLYDTFPNLGDHLPEKPINPDLAQEKAYVTQLLQVTNAQPKVRLTDKALKASHNLAECLDDINANKDLSPDKSARVGHKSATTSFYGYKTHLALTPERIITGAIITSGEKGDGKLMPDLVTQSKAAGIKVTEIIGDHAYSGKANLIYAKAHQLRLVAPLTPVISDGARNVADQWDFNKDAGMFVCPAGQMALYKRRTGRKNSGCNQRLTYFFDIKQCQTCPLRDHCYRPGAKSKTYSVTIKSSSHQDQLALQATDYFKKRVRLRYQIEEKNSELKIKHGYDVSWSNDIQSMRLQGAMTLFCVNMKRITKLITQKG